MQWLTLSCLELSYCRSPCVLCCIFLSTTQSCLDGCSSNIESDFLEIFKARDSLDTWWVQQHDLREHDLHACVKLVNLAHLVADEIDHHQVLATFEHGNARNTVKFVFSQVNQLEFTQLAEIVPQARQVVERQIQFFQLWKILS